MKTKIKSGIFIIVLLITNECFTQDIHFSQFSSSPATLNPASTGIFTGSVRAVYNFKDQWKTIAYPYRTHSFSVDMPIVEDIITDGGISGGISVLSDKAGDLNVGTTQINLSIAANKNVSLEHNISVGLQGGFAQWALDGSSEAQQWDSEYDPGVYGGYANKPFSITSSDLENFSYVDFSTGILWNYKGPIKVHAGIALFHLTKPTLSYLGDNEKLNGKMAFHGGAAINIKGAVIVALPQVLILKQGPQFESNIGALIKYRLQESSKYTGENAETAVYLGGWYRFGDAFIANVKMDYMNFSLGISYDVNVSNLAIATASKGGYEVALAYIHPLTAKRKTASPLL
ncbi:MAG TPA: type IX secretion system membrane protein PorP/SprF [Flavobacteriales bacterium]|nr:type IX secretion system membrane protein PorP/SprF [Flavobacteriales bacterium]HIN40064.1 type IX secretion system membrane protein PorP/SprF [Flavobacteriales bacterium]